VTQCTGTTGDLGKERLKRFVFKRFLKTDIDDADVTFNSRVELCSAVRQAQPEKLNRYG